MKTLLIVGSILLWLGYVVATAALSRFAGPPAYSELRMLFTTGMTVAVVNSLMLIAQILSNRTDPASPTGRRLYRRLALVFIGGLAVSAILTIIGGILLQSPPWVPAALIALTVACALVPVAAAVHYRRRLPAKSAGEDDWRTGTDRVRTLRRMGVTFVVATAVSVAGLAILVGTGVDDSLSVAEVAAFSLGLGAIVAGASGIVSAWRLNTSVSLIFGSTDLRVNRKVSRVVVWGRSDDLSESERIMAAKLARVWRDFLPVQTAQTALMFAGFFLLQLPRILRGDTEPIEMVLFSATAIIMLLVVFISRYQYRHVREYSDAHPTSDEALAA